MASSDTVLKLDRAKKDLEFVTSGVNFNQIRNNNVLLNPWNQSKALALKWLAKADPRLANTEDDALQPLELFVRRLVNIGEGQERRPNEDIPSAIRRVQNDFLVSLPLLAYEFIEGSGIVQFSENALHRWRETTVTEVRASVAEAERASLR